MIDEAKLKSVVATALEVDLTSVGDDTSMDTVEVWDSLRHIRLIMALEEEFGVSIPDDDADNMSSFKLIKLVMSELEPS